MLHLLWYWASPCQTLGLSKGGIWKEEQRKEGSTATLLVHGGQHRWWLMVVPLRQTYVLQGSILWAACPTSIALLPRLSAMGPTDCSTFGTFNSLLTRYRAILPSPLLSILPTVRMSYVHVVCSALVWCWPSLNVEWAGEDKNLSAKTWWKATPVGT